jgi:hypothetical protein
VDGDIGAVHSRIELHCYPHYTSGKKITGFPLNIVYRTALAARGGARPAIAATPQRQKSFARAFFRTKIIATNEVPIEWALSRHFLKT